MYALPPDLQERFDILSEIGSGGAATVWRARDKNLGRLLAIKIVKPNKLSSPADLARLQREAKTICRLHHPNIIKVYDFMLTRDQQPVMVMEYVEGRSLERLVIEDGPMSQEAVLRIFIHLCDAMVYTHKEGIFHRDLNGRNIMIAGDYEAAPDTKQELLVKILDFGIAKVEHLDDKTLSRTGRFIGTSLVASPEQARGQTIDARSDVYSLGCMMYLALTGKYPFQGAHLLETLQKQVYSEAPSLAEGNPERRFSNDLESVIATALAKAPSERFQNMEQFKDALECILQNPQRIEADAAENDNRKAHRFSRSKNNKIAATTMLCATASLAVLMAIIAWQVVQLNNPSRDTDQTTSRVSIENKNGMDWLFISGSLQPRSCLKLAENPNIQRVKLIKGCTIDKDALKKLAEHKLIILDLRDNKIDDQCLRIVSKCTSLRSLLLTGCTGFTDDGLKNLLALQNLQILTLDDTTIGDRGVETICRLPQLRLLYLSGSKSVTDACVPSLIKLNKVLSLEIGHTGINHREVQKFFMMPNLHAINIAGLDVEDNDLPKSISGRFCTLNFSDNKRLTGDIIARIIPGNLWYLDIRKCPGIPHPIVARFQQRHRSIYVKHKDETSDEPDSEYYLDPNLYDQTNYDAARMRDLVITQALAQFGEGRADERRSGKAQQPILIDR